MAITSGSETHARPTLDQVANSTVPDGSSAQWKDKKRYLWLIGLVVPSPGVHRLRDYQLTGWSVWLWIGPIIILGVVPAIDLFAGLDRSNPPDDVIEQLENDKYYRWITYVFLPDPVHRLRRRLRLDRPSPSGSAWSSSRRSASSASPSPSAASAASGSTPPTSSATRRRATSAGCPRSRSRRASTATSTSSTTAATTSASPPRRTPPAAGWARTSTSSGRAPSAGSLKSAWRLEKKRYARKGKHPFRIGNDVLNAWLMSAVLWGALMAVLGSGSCR